MTASAERTTPSQALPAPVGKVHHGVASAGRGFPPLETGLPIWGTVSLGSYRPQAGKATGTVRLCVRRGPPLPPRPAPACAVHGRAPPGAPGHMCVQSIRAPCGNLGYKKATARADVPPCTTARRTYCTRAIAIAPHCRVSHGNGNVPPGGPSHPCVHNVSAPCRILGYKEATARADVPTWTTAGPA